MGNDTFQHLNSIQHLNFKHYSQTFLNNHLCKTTNAESAQANSHPIDTAQDDHLYFFLPPKRKKKTCLKQQPQTFIQRRNAKKTQGAMHKKQTSL